MVIVVPTFVQVVNHIILVMNLCFVPLYTSYEFVFYAFSEEVEELAKRLKLRLFRTSVKEDFNVNEG